MRRGAPALDAEAGGVYIAAIRNGMREADVELSGIVRAKFGARREIASVIASLAIAALAGATPSAAASSASKQKADSLTAYQLMQPDERQAALETLTGTKLSSFTQFDTLDACVLREASEPTAGRAKLSATVAGCQRETGIGGTPAEAAPAAPQTTAHSKR